VEPPGAVRGRGMRVHRPARGQSPRLELTHRVFRPRRPRGTGRVGRTGSRSSARAARLAVRSAPAETREAVWELAGPLRSGDRLERLLGDPYPLARLIARFALAREESRGSHRRLEFPEQDPALDHRHLVCGGEELRWDVWD